MIQIIKKSTFWQPISLFVDSKLKVSETKYDFYLDYSHSQGMAYSKAPLGGGGLCFIEKTEKTYMREPGRSKNYLKIYMHRLFSYAKKYSKAPLNATQMALMLRQIL